MASESSLRYPPNFPPNGGWDRFFLGVRGLGPDTSFFKDLLALQARRTSKDLLAWGGGRREKLAAVLGEGFSKYCGWPTPYFLPDDCVVVVANGPRFGWADTTDAEEAVRFIEEAAAVTMGEEFWQRIHQESMAELVDSLLAAQDLGRGAGV